LATKIFDGENKNIPVILKKDIQVKIIVYEKKPTPAAEHL